MKLKPFLLGVCLLACCIARSQSQLKAFGDYEKCYAGFTNLDGDTIFKPQFNSVRYQTVKGDGTTNSFWHVKVGNYSGILSDSGVILIDWIYESIQIRFDSVLQSLMMEK
ncbi:MAG: hypothetical protein ACJAUD_001976 [Crocinitomicaceae bacterium]|jgi:hypothetical protein